MKILNVIAKDFKGIKLIEVAPLKTTTIVGGENKQGKSSLLDAIAATLGGTKLNPKRPIRDGEDEAKCEIKLEGDPARMLPACTVTRTWTRRKNGGIKSELEIITEDGFKAPTPQTILNDVVGPLGFDPERFLRMTAKEQSGLLRELVGLDFTKLDADRKTAYDKRTEVNRGSKAMAAVFDAMAVHEDAPEEEVSVAALMTELERRQAVNRRNEDERGTLKRHGFDVQTSQRQLEGAKSDVEDAEQRLKHAQNELRECEADLDQCTSRVEQQKPVIEGLTDADEAEIQKQVTDSEDVNRKVRENAGRSKLETELDDERKKSATLTELINELDASKQKTQAETEWPVADLGYDDDGVTLLGRPFEQASATEQREAAFGIVAALNPTLKFAMIKDGGLLDDKSLADFSRIAAERGFQLFVERVGKGEECTIIISEGEVEAKESV